MWPFCTNHLSALRRHTHTQAKTALLAAIVGTLSLLASRSETLSGLARRPTPADTAGAPALSALARAAGARPGSDLVGDRIELSHVARCANGPPRRAVPSGQGEVGTTARRKLGRRA